MELDLRIIYEAIAAADLYLHRTVGRWPANANTVRARFVAFALQRSRVGRDRTAAAEQVVAYLRAGHGDEIWASAMFDRISAA